MTQLALASEFPAATRDQWLKLVDGVLKGADFDKRLVPKTYDGIAIQPLGTHRAEAAPVARASGAAPWLIGQRIDFTDPAAANAQALEDLMNGANALSLVFADSPGAQGFGLKDASKTTLTRVLNSIHLDMGVTISLDIGRETKDAGSIIADIARAKGVAADKLDILFGYDPIGIMASRGDVSPWPEASPVLLSMIKAHLSAGFKGRFIGPDGRVVHAAGGSEAQELAFILSSAVAYLRALEAGGLTLDQARDALYVRIAVDADQFLSIAKLRALRKLWARIEAACGLAAKPLFVAAETAWRMQTRIDPQVTILRNTVAVFAGAIGGADLITVLPHTAALGLPDGPARRLARNTQVVLGEESNLYRVIDPSAGAGAIEDITDRIAASAWALFQTLEGNGGIAGGAYADFTAAVAATLAARRKAVATRKDPLTGASEFPNIREAPVAVLAPAPRVAASGGLAPIRLSEAFEALRESAATAAPKVFLANLGTVADFTARTIYAKNVFEAGGIEALANDGFPSLDALVAAFKASGAKAACICSSDAIYAEQAATTAAALKAAGATVYLAGRPGDLEAPLKAAGVEAFVFVGCDVIATLTAAQARIGIASRP